MLILRVFFTKSAAPYRAGEAYLLEEPAALDALAAGVLDHRAEIPEPQTDAVDDATRKRIAELFAPPPPPVEMVPPDTISPPVVVDVIAPLPEPVAAVEVPK